MDGIPVDLGVLGRAFRYGRTQVVDTSDDGEFIEAVPGLVAEIAIPLAVDGRVRAVFSVESTRPFQPVEHHEVERVAVELGQALERTGVDEPAGALHALVRAGTELATLADEEAVAHAAVRLTCAVAGTSSSMIAFPSPGGETAVRAAAGPLAPALRRLDPAALRTLARDLGGVSSCLAGGDADGRVHPVFDDIRRSGGTSLSVFPVRCGTADVGLLFAVDQVPGGLGADHREATELLAGTVARTLDHVRVHASLRFRAERDALTMVGNRGAFDEALASLDGPARRHEQVAVLLVDIDRFKQVNDRFGHVVGDQVLVETAQSMLDCLRHDDRLFRIGGDEFAILVPGIDQLGADHLGERLAERTRAALDAVHAGLSVGAAVRGPGEPITDCVVRADGALYAAKAPRGAPA
ncbi:MAG: diguanylate cyclase domain-containing protein [Acidimicrobiia bacterium]